MKTIIFSFIALLLITGNFSYGQTKKQILMAEAGYRIKKSTWQITDSTIYTYTPFDSIATKVEKNYDSQAGKLVNYIQNIYTYDQKHNLVCDYWKLANKQNEFTDDGVKKLKTYDANNKLISEISLSWDAEKKAFSDESKGKKTLFTYDAKGNLSSATIVGAYKNTYFYDAKNNLVKIVLQNWDDKLKNFTSNSEQSYTYNDNNKLVSIIEVIKAGQPSPNWRNTYTYDAAGNLTVFLQESWEPEKKLYRPSTKRTYTYTKSNLVASETEQEGWDSTKKQLENKTYKTYTYNSNNKVSQINIQMWDSDTNSFVDAAKKIMYYKY